MKADSDVDMKDCACSWTYNRGRQLSLCRRVRLDLISLLPAQVTESIGAQEDTRLLRKEDAPSQSGPCPPSLTTSATVRAPDDDDDDEWDPPNPPARRDGDERSRTDVRMTDGRNVTKMSGEEIVEMYDRRPLRRDDRRDVCVVTSAPRAGGRIAKKNAQMTAAGRCVGRKETQQSTA